MTFKMRPMQFAAKQVAETGVRLTVEEATAILFAELSLPVTSDIETNFIGAVEGAPGTGKSEVGQALAFFFLELTGGAINLVFDPDKIKADKLLSGDCVALDEWIIPEGPQSRLIIQRLWNIISTVRAEMISFLIISPSLPELKFVNFILYTVAMDTDNRVNLVNVMAPWKGKMVDIGDAIVPLHDDEVFRTRYKKAKKKRIRENLAKKGKSFVDGNQDIAAIAESVASECLNMQLVRPSISAIKGVMDAMKVQADTGSLDKIAGLAKAMLRGATGKKDSKLKVVVDSEYTGNATNLQDAVIEQLEARGVADPQGIEFIRMYVKGAGQDSIAESFGIGQSKVSKKIKQLGQLELGYAFEDVYAAFLRSQNIKFERGGYNEPTPDVIILDKAGEPVEVHSLKCHTQMRNRSAVTFYPRDFAKSEMEMYEQGIPLYLVYYDFVIGHLYPPVKYTGQPRITFSRHTIGM